MDLSIVIPAYNEEKIIKRSVENILKETRPLRLKQELIIIENGSTDRTYPIAKELAKKHKEVKVLRCRKADYGFAMKHGMLNATGKAIVNFDIDFYDIKFLKISLAMIENGFDLVIGSKNLKCSQDTRGILRRTISRMFTIILSLFFGLKVSETHGIKGWKNTPRLKAYIRRTVHGGNIYDTELILRAQKKIRIVEIPIKVVELRSATTSIFRRIIKTFGELWSLWWTLRLGR